MICPREEDWGLGRTGGGAWILYNAAGEFVMCGLEFCPWCGCNLDSQDHQDYPPDEQQAVAAGKCRECGCTEFNACVGGPLGACWWVEPDLCSACDAKGE